MSRRSVFGENTTPAVEPSPVMSVPPPVAMVDLIPVAEQRKRSRLWDAARRGGQVTYRGIPKDVQEAVKGVAGKLNVSVDDAARALMECGWGGWQRKELVLSATIKGVRMTLYPEVDEARVAKKVKRRGRKEQPVWKRVVTYRGMPEELKVAVKTLADEKHVPVGEVARAFLQYGLTAVETGALSLKPVEAGVGLTLFGQ